MDAQEQFLNRKRWSGIDLKKLESAVRKFDPDKLSLDKYLELIQPEFPTRSATALRAKFEEIADHGGIRLAPSTEKKAEVVARFDSRWTPDEMAILHELIHDYDPTKKSASEFARDIADFFRERHTEAAIMQKVTILTRDKRKEAERAGTAIPRGAASWATRRAQEADATPEPAERTPAAQPVQSRLSVAPAPAVAQLPQLPAPSGPRPVTATGLQHKVVYDAKVTGLAEYGVFIGFKLPGELLPISGLVHFSEIWGDGVYRGHPSTWFDVDDPVKVVWLETTLKGHRFSMHKAGFVPEMKHPPAELPALPAPAEPSSEGSTVEEAIKRMDTGLRAVLSDFADLRSQLRKAKENQGDQEALEAAWSAIEDALECIDALDIRKAQMVLSMYKANYMSKKV